MSSSSSAAALSRSRSLRQPVAGRGGGRSGGGGSQAGRDDREGLISSNGNNLNKGAAPTASASSSSASASTNTDPRVNSPSKLPKFGSSATTMTTAAATRTRAGTTGARSGLPSSSGTTTTGTRSRPNSGIFGVPSTSTTTTTGSRSRPNSGIFGLDRSNSLAARKPAAQNDATSQAETTKTVRPMASTSRLMRPKSISSAPKLSPTTSSRPGPAITANSSTAKPQSPISKTHARTKSQATSLTSATTLRPPRPPSAGSTASTSTSTTTATAASRRPVGRLNNTSARPTRQEQASATSLTTTPSAYAPSTSNPTTSTTTSRAAKPAAAATATDDAPRLRPAFTSFQQHYSPARNVAPKPLTSTFLAPPSPSKLPANVAISSETARLQTELLQLHILHRDVDAVTASWHASARDRLKTRFDALAEADKGVSKDEAALEEAHNIAALAAWAPDGEGLDDRIQALDGILSGLWSLGESGGRYARVVRKFEKWFDAMRVSVEARRQAGGVGALTESNEVAFIKELEPAWKEEVSQLTRKLDGWCRQLAKLQIDIESSGLSDNYHEEKGGGGDDEDGGGSSSSSSSLARILAGCRAQTHDMLAELDLMEQIERDAISQEAAWIKRMNRDDDEADDTPRAGAIWRAF